MADFNDNFVTSTPSIASLQYQYICTTSGASLTLIHSVSVFLGGLASWDTEANLNGSVYIDSLTPDVTLISAGHADYETPGWTVPASGGSCDGTFTGTFSGDLKVSSGQTCIFTGGGVTGHVTQTGGELVLTNATVGGNVKLQGSGTFSIGPFTTIGGNLEILNIPEGTSTNEVCSTNVKGNVKVEDIGTSVQIGSDAPTCAGNSIGGHLLVKDNTGLTNIFDNFVTDNLHVEGDTGSTQVYNNNVGKNLLLQSNSGSTQVFNNIVVNNLRCETNSSISGGGNTAKKKEGQCTSF